MKRLLVAAFVAAFALPAFAGPVSASYMDPRSPLRSLHLTYRISATADASGVLLGVCPPGGAKVKDIVVAQASAGVAGLRWTITPKKGADSLVTTAPGFTLAAGANHALNLANRPISWASVSGGTRPVLDATKATCSGGDVFTADLDLEGTHASGTATLADSLAVDEKITIESVDLVAKYRYAFNTVTCASVAAADKVTIAGIEFAAVAGAATGKQFSIDGTDAQDCAALAASVTAATDAALVGVVQATNTAGQATVVFQSVAEGAAGNDITLTTSNGTRLAITTAGGKLAGAYASASCEWPVRSTLAESATALAQAINDCTNAAIETEVSAAAADAVVTVTAAADGTAGNAYTLTKTGDHITVSGSGTLSGGSPYTTAVTGWLELYLEPNY